MGPTHFGVRLLPVAMNRASRIPAQPLRQTDLAQHHHDGLNGHSREETQSTRARATLVEPSAPCWGETSHPLEWQRPDVGFQEPPQRVSSLLQGLWRFACTIATTVLHSHPNRCHQLCVFLPLLILASGQNFTQRKKVLWHKYAHL